jgi:hypothetical protein
MLNKSGSKYCFVLSLKVYVFMLFELLYIFTIGTSFKFLEPLPPGENPTAVE